MNLLPAPPPPSPRCRRCQARIQAALEFSEDASLGASTLEDTRPLVQALLADLRHHLAQARRGEATRSG